MNFLMLTKTMPKKILFHVLLFLTVVAAFFSWYSVDRAIFAEGASDFWVPLGWFSFFAVMLSLSIVLVRKRVLLWAAFFVSLSVSFFFVHSFLHLATVALSWVFVYAAQRSIEEDIETSIKIHLMKSLHRGIFLVVIAFVLMISSQYYFSIRTLESERIAPNISKGGTTSWVINMVLPRISPEFQQVKSDEITTDEFLGEIYETIIKKEGEEIKNKLESGASSLQKDQAEKMIENELGRKLTNDERKQLEAFESGSSLKMPSVSPQIKQDIIREWKKELSKSAGSEIKGDEKVSDLFVVIMNSKIDELAEPRAGKEKSKVLPLIFTMVLFLTLIPLGSFASRFWTGIAAGMFWVLRKAGLVSVVTETREAEVIR
ncbi:MAG: hypothetical protein UW95_C0006G0040 [Parcubacteria group bacterium GW2011_GWC1_45_14]|nr:MAG: hypothetical protein UW87_C0013G0009 [Candidatus Moranbacteria bacterium GW2011_GWC2_45_10]KKT94975.1 MAG: hypothetical protein UW95_C0006G0040 [Parcubacteria group bacterium GW2011_GWC1_45_14]